jgi:hypothetical protein
MGDIRPDVQEFMHSCQRLFGFANRNGGLNAEECRVLFHYTNELQNQIHDPEVELTGNSRRQNDPFQISLEW